MKRLLDTLSGVFGKRAAKFAAEVASCSELGLVRKENQDSIHVDAERLAFCVADGMGGGQGGGEASAIAVRHFADAIRKSNAYPSRIRRVYEEISVANSEIRAVAKAKGYEHMGTTITVMLADARTGDGVIGYVGDSRAYLYRDGKLKQLTRDHTLATELASQTGESGRVIANLERFSHVLTRSLGSEEDVFPEWRKADIKPGDYFLVCSDGLYGMMDFASIESAFADAKTPAEALRTLSANVVIGGAMDNYSAIVVKIVPVSNTKA